MRDPKVLILFIAWLAASVYALSNGIYALRNPEKWLDASWTATRGFGREKPLSPDSAAKISAFGAQCLIIGCVLSLIVIVIVGRIAIAHLH